MKISQAKLASGLLGIIFLFGACTRNETSDTNSAASNVNQTSNSSGGVIANDDVEELRKLVNLPLAPEEATFGESDLIVKNSESRTSATNQKKIVAVLKFSPENADQIIANAEKHKPPAPSDVEAENWFPPELVAQSQISGDEALKGVAYAANDFYQPPFNNGKLTRINSTDYFVLELTSF